MGYARAAIAGGLLVMLSNLDFEAAVAGDYDVARSVLAFFLLILLLVAPEAILAWKGESRCCSHKEVKKNG